MRLPYIIVFLALLAFCRPTVSASPATAEQSSEWDLTIKGTVIDSLSREPLAGAVITVAIQRYVRFSDNVEVRNVVADKDGKFTVQVYRAPEGAGQLEVSHLGYRLKNVPIDVSAYTIDVKEIEMAVSVTEIDEVVVQSRLEMFRVKGDTIVYFPSSVRTMEGDAAIEILRNMPGVEVLQDGNIKIGDKQVERTYVNGELLFGMDPRLAFKYLIPGQIATIEAYDEVDEQDVVLMGEDKARTRKVLNVKTREKIGSVSTAGGQMAAGADFRESMGRGNQLRYSAAGEANIFNSKRQMELAVSHGNASPPVSGGGDFYYSFGSFGGGGFGGDGYTRSTQASAGYSSSKTGSPHRYSLRYQYSNTHSISESRTLQEYFDGSRTSDNSSRNVNRSDNHNFWGSYDYNDWEKFSGRASAGVTFGRNTAQGRLTNIVTGNNGLNVGNDQRTRNTDKPVSVSAGLSGSLKVAKKVSINNNSDLRYSDATTDGFRRDSSLTDATTAYIIRNGDAPSVNFTNNFSTSYTFSEKFMVLAAYNVNYDKSRSQIIAYDRATLEIDSTDTRYQTTNNFSHGPMLSLNYGNRDERLSFSVSNRNTRMKKDDRYGAPSERNLSRRFSSWAPQMSYSLNKVDMDEESGNSSIKSMHTSLSYGRNEPNLEMFSNKLERSGLYLTGGNPYLKPADNMIFNFMLSRSSGEKSLQFNLSASGISNAIVRQERFFDTQTYLPQYNYTAEAGSTLSTYVNAGKSLTLDAGATYGRPIVPIKVVLYTGLSYGYSNPQEGVADGLVRTQHHHGSFKLGLNSNFSRKFRISAESETRYTSATQAQNENRRYDTWSFNLNTTMDWEVVSFARLSANYMYNGVRNSINKDGSTNDHVLNLSVSYRIFKTRKGLIGFHANDVLNNGRNTRIYTDNTYISTTWQRRSSSYFMFTFEYRFNKAQ